MNLARYVRTDEELQQMRKEWKERFEEPFLHVAR